MLTDTRSLKRTIKKLADFLVHEVDSNPEFAERLYNTWAEGITPGTRGGASASRPPKAPSLDPFPVLRDSGADKFREWLSTLTVSELRAIVRQHRLDPTRLSDKWKTKERLVNLVFERVLDRSSQGDAFRNYQEPRQDTDRKAENDTEISR